MFSQIMSIINIATPTARANPICFQKIRLLRKSLVLIV
jgi:hypothetical protein